MPRARTLRHREPFHARPDALGHGHGAGHVGLRQDHGILVAADARRCVARAPQHRSDDARDRGDRAIAALMAEGVVVAFEIVDVDQQ